MEVELRLYVGATDAERSGSFFPRDVVLLPAREAIPTIKALLGRDSRVALLASPDLLAPSNVLAAIDEEPQEDDDLAGEEWESTDEEFETVGEAELSSEEREAVGEEE